MKRLFYNQRKLSTSVVLVIKKCNKTFSYLKYGDQILNFLSTSTVASPLLSVSAKSLFVRVAYVRK